MRDLHVFSLINPLANGVVGKKREKVSVSNGPSEALNFVCFGQSKNCKLL